MLYFRTLVYIILGVSNRQDFRPVVYYWAKSTVHQMTRTGTSRSHLNCHSLFIE